MQENEKTHVVPNDKKGKLLKRTLFVLTFICTLCGMVHAQEQKTIRLKVNNESLTSVLKKISTQSGAKINFNTDDTSRYMVTANVENKTVAEVLGIVLTGKPFTYTSAGGIITISKVEQKQETVQASGGRLVKGRVVDDTNQPLTGVSIRLKVPTNPGAVTDIDGRFSLRIPTASTTLVFSFIGMKSTEVIVKPGNEAIQLKDVIMEEDNASLDEVVVVGVFNKPRESYTGAATNFSRKQLEAAGNRNMITSLRNLDPSFNIADNISIGSDPNSLPSITIRGASSLPTDVKDMQVSTENQTVANQPLFLLDGFEITLARFMDLDENQIESITLLKDANATALYGSKGSNGVVVITSKRIEAGKLRLTYKGTLSIEAPDLTSYNLMSASEKLQYEKAAGLYYTSNANDNADLQDLYNLRKIDVERGVNTYWLKHPVHTGVGSRHSISLEGGDQSLRYGAGLSYNNTVGAMKDSERNVMNGNMFLQYRYKTLNFQNNLQITDSESLNSPYGSFSDYCKLNSYFAPYDGEGNTQKILENYYYESLRKSNKVYSPLYDALLPSKNSSSYTSITNNFAMEWYLMKELFFRGQFSFTKTFSRSDKYVSADATMFEDFTGDNFSRKGRYTYGSGESSAYEGRFTLNYTKDFGKKHQVFAGLGLTIEEAKSEMYTVVGEGISVNNMDFLGMANRYLKDGRPTGTESFSRGVGALFNVRYTYDRRYFVDLNGKYDGSSQFGSNNHFAPFWSTGVGWNLHNEKFMLGSRVVNIARLRGSYGVTGSQNFASYLSIRSYQDFGGKNTQNWYGTYLMAYGNPDLQWQKTAQLNVGADLEMFERRIQASVDVYSKLTDNLLADINLPLSSGFVNYKANVGKVLNKGIEANLTAQIIRDVRNDFRWTVGVKAIHNSNKIKEISNSLQALNEDLGNQKTYNASFLYKEGESLNTIYAVRSKGIDPSSGREIFVKLDGTETFTWSAKDKVACGVAEPKVLGNINTSVRWKGVTANLIFGYRLGGYAYNTTLANKVENINPYDNADRRVLYDRWKKPGDVAMFKSVLDKTTTYATSRFVFKDNTIYCSALNLGYEFPSEWSRKHLSISYLALNGCIEDLFWESTIKRERGTDYPFSRKFSMALTARF